MSRGGGRKLKNIRAKNYIFYLKIFYKYIKDFKKESKYPILWNERFRTICKKNKGL